MTLAQLVDSLVATFQVGSLYALMAVGLTLTMAVTKLPNFAHAELITVGAYTALVVSLFVTGNPILAIGLAFPASALLAWIAHRTVYRPLQRQRASTYVLILASFAVGLIVRYLLFLFVDRFDLFDKRIQIPLQVLVENGPVRLTNIFVWVVPSSILLVGLLSVLLNFTGLGRQMRALADNETMARVVGLPVDRVVDLTWLLVGGLAGVAGALWGHLHLRGSHGRLVDPPAGVCRGGLRRDAQLHRHDYRRVHRGLWREHGHVAAEPVVWPGFQLQAGHSVLDHHSGAADPPARLCRPRAIYLRAGSKA